MTQAFQAGPGRAVVIAAMAATLLLAGCSDSKKDKASQTAAKVNKEEITVHEINFVMQQQRGLKPEQTEAASKQILERLIDQELALQKAEDLKLDREPRVMQQLEAAKREIIARSYIEKTGATAAKPTPEEIKKYYDEHPALFKERRIYSIQEIAIEATPDQVPALREHLQEAKSISDFVEYLKASSFKFSGNQAVRAAEQLPLNMLDAFAKMKDGQAILAPTAPGAQVIVLAGARAEPVDEVRAKPAIEQFLWNDAKRKLLEADMKAMRAAAKIEYVGKFAEAAASAPGAASAPAAAAPPPAASAAAGEAKPAAGGLGAGDIAKGMGLK
ncbi:MAG: EpsD family peptidyl-prolyl cis-trans isomerase [Burkholderiales bacterium]